MEEFLEQQLLIRIRVFATFSTIEKALAGCMKSFRGRMLCTPADKIVLAPHERK